MGEGSRRRSRSGGGAARRAERTAVSVETERYIDRKIPLYELLDNKTCLLYTSPSPRDRSLSRMPSSA